MAFGNQLARLACEQRRSVVVALSLALVSWSCAHSLSGNLKDAEGKPVVANDGRINVIQLDGNAHSTKLAEVDSEGNFQLEDTIESGTYLIEALVPGYHVASIKMDVTPPAKVEFVLKKNTKINPITIGSRLYIDDSVGAGGASLAPPKL